MVIISKGGRNMKLMLTKIVALFTFISAFLGWMVASEPIRTGVLPESADTVVQDLSIMTFNVYVFGTGKKSPENRTQGVIKTILAQSPDSFGLQEADEGWIERLCENLSGYAYVGVGRDGDGGEASPVFYLKDKYELLDSGTFWLSNTPDTPSKGWDAAYKRICTFAVLRDKETGFTYSHFNTHLDHLGPVSRIKSVGVIMQRIAELNLPCVLTGDFNSKEGTVPYEYLLKCGLFDSKYLAQDSDSGATFHSYYYLDKINSRPIDFIFASNQVRDVYSYKIIRDKVDGIYPSDHFAVSVRMSLANQAG